MDNAAKFLERYLKLSPPQSTKKKLLIKTIQDECGVSITEDQIKLHKEGVFLNCHPIIKTEIVRNQQGIISALHNHHNTRISFIR